MAHPKEIARHVVDTMLSRDKFSKWLGIKATKIEPEAIELEMQVTEDMLNGFGICHGGVMFAFADSALAFAANSCGKLALVTDGQIAFTNRVDAGDELLATTNKFQEEDKKVRFDVTIQKVGDEEGEPVAIFTGMALRTNRAFE